MNDSSFTSPTTSPCHLYLETNRIDCNLILTTTTTTIYHINTRSLTIIHHHAQASLAPVLAPVVLVHQMWGAPRVRAYNEVLGGELRPEVELLQGVGARWAEGYGSVEGEA